jgi:cell division protein FtsI (penicillin-binding protein 3)
MYVEKKDPGLYAMKKDSSTYFYAGNTHDIKNVYQTLNVGYADSVQQNEWSHVYAANYQPVMRANSVKQQVMPNVKGMGLKDALNLLESMGMKVSVRGKGKIVTQSVLPGKSLAKGITVILELAV